MTKDIEREHTKYLAELLEREVIKKVDFEDIVFKSEINAFHSNYLSARFMDNINFGWKIWQAAIARMEVRINTLDEILLNQGEALAQAKAQAIPEGFVLVPKEPTDAMLFAASGRDIVAEHYGDENIMWPELRETWKAMLEAARGGNE